MWGLRNADEGKVRVIEKRKKLAARLFAAGAPTVKMNGRLLQSDNTKEVELLKEFEDVSCYRQKLEVIRQDGIVLACATLER